MRTFVGRWYMVLIAQRRARRVARLRAAASLIVMIALAGCSGQAVKPDAPQPPRIDCRQHNTGPLNPPPYYVWEFPTYVAELIGLLIEERRLRTLEQDCIQQHKDKGVIR
jgi:hypothetical protein